MSNLNVLVVGASIAGPTTAYWLAKAGANVTVIERFPTLRTNGQGIDIRTAGVTIMRKMAGMEAAVRAKTTPQEGVTFVGPNGQPVATMKASGNADRQSLSSEFEIFRGDLAQILFDLTKDNDRIKYVFGEQVASMRQQDDDGPMTVEFANGYPTTSYDLVVAADGATSRTRAMGFNCGVRDHIKPVNCWAAYFSVKDDLLDGSKLAKLWCAPGGRALGIGPDPAGVNRVTAFGIYPRDQTDPTLPFREAMKKGEATLKHYVAQHLHGSGWKSDQIITGMLASTDFYASEIVQLKPPTLSSRNGRFVLVGDAGYCPSPFSGAGTSLAITGAYILAGEISQHKNKDDLRAALSAYEARMKPIVDDLQSLPPFMPGFFAPQTAWAIWVRNTILSFVVWTRVLEWAGQFFGSALGKDKYGIPDYTWER